MSSLEDKQTCSNKSCCNEGVKRCTKCKTVRYCDRDCQVDHWKTHRRLCNVLTCPQKHARYLQAYRYIKDGHQLIERTQFDESLVEYRKALPIFQELLGETHEDTATCYNMIGGALWRKRQFEEALVELRKALAIYREVHGENHDNTSKCYDTIGTVFLHKYQSDDALIVYGKSLAIRLRLFGENHTDTAQSHCNAGATLLQKHRVNDALVSFCKAHDIFLREYGENHIQTIRTFEAIGAAEEIRTTGKYYPSDTLKRLSRGFNK